MQSDPALAAAIDREQVEEWIDEARRGSAPALDKLLSACRGHLLNMAHRRTEQALRPKVSASDLVQETCLDAHRDFAEFHGQKLDELLAWLRRILLYNAANARRHYQHTAKRDTRREISLHGLQRGAELRDPALTPRSLLSEIEERQRVERALERLPDDYRTVILLRSREHLAFADVGVRMGRSADAARKLWFRAVERLQLELGVIA